MSKSEGQVLDFEKICRLCLLEKRSMSAIFSKKKSDKKVPLPVRIMSCASLELYEGDGLPASICSKCLLSVNQSYAFREQCEQADTTLRQYAQRMNEASEEASTNRESRECIANDSLERVQDIGIKKEKRKDDSEGESIDQGNKLDSSDRNSKIDSMTVYTSNNSKKKVTFQNDSVEECSEVLERLISEEKLCKSEKSIFLNSKENFQTDFENEDSSDAPILRALSNEKAENVVVIADVDAINVKFPEDGDVDFGGAENTSSDEDDSQWKTQTPYDGYVQKKTKQEPSFAQLFNRRKSYNEASPKKSSFENQKHMELLQNLMKNKNIIVRKRAASGSVEVLREKDFVRKNLEFKKSQRKNITFPYDFKIAQLWKEWEEVSKRIAHVSKKSSSEGLENGLNARKVIVETFTTPEFALEKVANEVRNNEEEKPKWKNGKSPVYCKECGIFLLRSSYNNHVKFVHQKVRKYLCQTCGYTACTGTILRQHMQAVHVGYSFSCDQCQKKFNLMKRLRKHIEMEHSGKPVERNHVCQYCGMAFTKNACLKRHLRTHTQETPYQCQYCQRRFKYRWPKVQHERLHTGEQPYKCSYCEERFTQNSVRKAHEYKKHGNEKFKPKTRITRGSSSELTEVLKTEKEESENSSHGSYHSGTESN